MIEPRRVNIHEPKLFSKFKVILNCKCNRNLTLRLLTILKKAVPLHPVISFSVINYVVSMRHPRASDEVSFCFIWSQRAYNR